MNARASHIAARGTALTLLLGTVAAQGMSWPDVWLRPDQQAQRILESGNAAAAAALFQDPRRRAYAELESKRYDDAAKRLEPFKDAPSQYNRGNALARAGQLPAALAAYDAALRAADADSEVARDAKLNRDLVARQLDKQRSPPQQSQDQSQPRSQQQQSPQQQASAGKAGESGQNPEAQQRDGRQTEAPAPDKEQRNAQQAAAQRAESEQARRDAAAAIAQSAPQPAAPQHPSSAQAQSALHGSEASGPRVEVPADALRPESEQTMALDQWLRAMPDDPSGLLRRKFMIEHMMKQRQMQP